MPSEIHPLVQTYGDAMLEAGFAAARGEDQDLELINTLDAELSAKMIPDGYVAIPLADAQVNAMDLSMFMGLIDWDDSEHQADRADLKRRIAALTRAES